jgi:AcrR family transcriptional regulator
MSDSSSTPRPSDDPRRRKLMETAMTVFTRYGFRKTSMDEVAQAANVSRQGLYLHFATKEELFRAAVEHTLDTWLEAAAEGLADASLPLERRLVRGFDAWVGPYIGMIGAGATDLVEASKELLGPVVMEREAAFVDAVAKTLRASGLMAAYKPSGLTARQLADTLYATARGLKQSCASRAAFVDGITIAARAMCLPLRDAP